MGRTTGGFCKQTIGAADLKTVGRKSKQTIARVARIVWILNGLPESAASETVTD